MRRVGVVGFLAVALAAAAGYSASPASATYTPTAAPYTQSSNNTLLTNLLQVPDAPPSSPARVTVPGYTYPDAWNEAAKAQQAGRLAGRFAPALTLVGKLFLAATAFEMGWQIGSPFGSMIYNKLTGGLGTPAAGGYSPYFWSWTASGLTADGTSSGISGVPDSGWLLCASNGPCFDAFQGAGSPFGLGGAENTKAAAVAAAAGATTYEGSNAGTPPNANNNRFYVVSAAAMESKVTRAPITATEFGSYGSTYKKTSTYSPTPMTTTDLANYRGALGNAVAGKTGGVYVDGSANPLTTGQVQAQVDTNCNLDSSYCTGGANDPFGAGSPIADTFTMPNLAGLSVTAADAALDALGHTGTRTYTVLDIDGAVLTQPAGAVVTQSSTYGSTVPKTGTITFSRNPTVLPFELPQPLRDETYDDYVTRLQGLGFVGTFTSTELEEATSETRLGPLAPVRITAAVGTATLTHTYSPLAWPEPDPRLDNSSTTNIRVAVNAPTMAPMGAPMPAPSPDNNPPDVDGASTPAPPILPGGDVGGGGGDCDCPPIDLSPLTETHASDKFPFGVFAYMGTVLGWFDVTPVAPGFDISVSALDGQHYQGDLGFFDEYMDVIRTLLSFVLWIGAVWLFATRILGFRAAGDLTDAADEGMVTE